jgi:hypothetical protein
VTFLESDIDRDGGRISVSGAPQTFGDDEERMSGRFAASSMRASRCRSTSA